MGKDRLGGKTLKVGSFLDEFEKLSDNTQSKCKIVMLTSSINPQDVNKSKKYAYVKQYINKPLSQENLEKMNV